LRESFYANYCVWETVTLTTDSKPAGQPIAVLGAGDLISHLHRESSGTEQALYRFNVCRISASLRMTHGLHSTDLLDLVKLCQVLAFAITDDGWLPNDERSVLLAVNEELDELTQRWSGKFNG